MIVSKKVNNCESLTEDLRLPVYSFQACGSTMHRGGPVYDKQRLVDQEMYGL